MQLLQWLIIVFSVSTMSIYNQSYGLPTTPIGCNNKVGWYKRHNNLDMPGKSRTTIIITITIITSCIVTTTNFGLVILKIRNTTTISINTTITNTITTSIFIFTAINYVLTITLIGIIITITIIFITTITIHIIAGINYALIIMTINIYMPSPLPPCTSPSSLPSQPLS